MEKTQAQLVQELMSQDEASLQQALVRHWGKQELTVIGQYRRAAGSGVGFFVNLMDDDGNLLTSPEGLETNPKAFVPSEGFVHEAFYRFRAVLNDAGQRAKHQNPYYLRALPASIEPSTEAQTFVQGLHDQVEGNERLARMVANFFRKISGDLYQYKERFVFELIQNADDYPDRGGRVQLRFIFEDDYLVVLHNGAPFSRRNVDAVCDIGESDEDKQTDITKIGYKGIGFKSLFIDADCVYIRSGLFAFRFEKPQGPEKVVRAIPWQVKPLWGEPADLPPEVQRHLSGAVGIVLRLKRETLQTYKTKLRGIFQEPRFLLFLRHVHSIAVVGLEREELVLRKAPAEGRPADIELWRGRSLQSTWRLSSFPVAVPEHVAAAVEDDDRVPEKMMLVKQSNLVFAAQVEGGQLVPVPPEKSVLFNYLPTDVSGYAFPFLVNADFLTSASRESLHSDCAWNHFLFEEIGFRSIQWLAAAASGGASRNFLRLFKPKFEPATGELQEAYNRGLDRACLEIAFIPSAESPELLKAGEAILDETGLAADLGYDVVRQHLGRPGARFVARDVEGAHVLKKLGTVSFGMKDLPGFLGSPLFATASTDLLVRVVRRLQQAGASAPDLSRVAFLPDADGTRRLPGSLYLDPGADQRAHTGFDQFFFLAAELTARLNATPELLTWVRTRLGVKTFAPTTIIQERIQSNRLDFASLEENLHFVRFLFKHRNGQWNKASLAGLHVVCTVGKTQVRALLSNCHLPRAYQPPFALEDVPGLEGSKFVSPDYCTDPGEVAEWRQFFLALNVIPPDGLKIIDREVLPRAARGGLDEAEWVRLTSFLFQVWKEKGQAFPQPLRDKLRDWKLRTRDHGLQPARACLLDAPFVDQRESLPDIALANRVAPDYAREAGGTAAEWGRFFAELSARRPSDAELLNEKVAAMLAEPKLCTPANSATLLKEILDRWEEVSEASREKLRTAPLVLTVKGELVGASSCYFSNAYQPANDMERFLANTDFSRFVSPAYIDPLGTGEEWKARLAKLQVREALQVVTTTERKAWRRGGLGKYAQLLPAGPTDAIELEGFAFVAHITEYAGNYEFCMALWRYLDDAWEHLNLQVRSETVAPRRAVPTHFKFCLDTLPLIPCTDGVCRKASEVFSSKKKELVEGLADHHLPALKLRDEIVEFAGLKTHLTAADLVKALDAIQHLTLTTAVEKRIFRLYRFLNTELAQGSAEVPSLPPSLRLLAWNDSFQPVDKLRVLAPSLEMVARPNSHLLKLSGNQGVDDLAALLAVLGVTPLGWEDFELEPENRREDPSLRERIEERLPYIAALLGGGNAKDRVRDRLDRCTFYQVDKLVARCKAIDFEESIPNRCEKDATSDMARIYYVGSWRRMRHAALLSSLVELLGLNRNRITADHLLTLLDEDTDSCEKLLREMGAPLESIVKATEDVLKDTPAGPPTLSQATKTTTDGVAKEPRQIDKGKGLDPLYWGEVGETWGRNLYKWLGYSQVLPSGSRGYDYDCQGLSQGQEPGLPAHVNVEVKARGKSGPGANIRLTLSEWEFLLDERNQDEAELLVVYHHNGRNQHLDSVEKLVRVARPRETLSEIMLNVLGNTFQQPIPPTQDEGVEALVSLQHEPRENGSTEVVVLLNWQRLLQGTPHRNITVYNPVSETSFTSPKSQPAAR